MSKYDRLIDRAYRTAKGQSQLKAFVKKAMDGYRTIADATEVTGDPRYGGRGAKIWYYKRDYSRDITMGHDWLSINMPELIPSSLQDLKETHVLLGEVGEGNPDEVFQMMQGTIWSPRGQANSLIRSKKLNHTSMNVGDVIQFGNQLYMVDQVGFERVSTVKTARPDTPEANSLLLHIENNYDLHKAVREQEKDLMKALLEGKQPSARLMLPVVETAAKGYFKEYAPKSWKDMFSVDEIKNVATELTKHFLISVKSGEAVPDNYDLDGEVDRSKINPRNVRAMDKKLRDDLIKLAYNKPELRPHLLPLLKTAGDFEDDVKGKK
jgi:hypothetical protein